MDKPNTLNASGNTKNRLVLQFHVTGKCNLRCKHCYRTEGDVEKLTLADVKAVIDQFMSLKEKYNKLQGIKKRGHINITGGEPFFRKDIKEILYYLGERKEKLTYAILSNGSFLDDEMIGILKTTQVSFVQLSIDGDRKTHDELRAKGDYERVFKMAEKLETQGVRTYISFTANRENYKYIPKVAAECRKKQISRLWSDRLVPIGTGEGLKQLSITQEEFPSYMQALKKAQGNILTKWLCPKTHVTMNRALQFIDSDGALYSCSAGNSLLTVDEFGRIMPCRRMPIYCGDIFSTSLEEVYFNHEVFRALRLEKIPEECVSCHYGLWCKGGAKCQSFAEYGTYHRADPACPLRNEWN